MAKMLRRIGWLAVVPLAVVFALAAWHVHAAANKSVTHITAAGRDMAIWKPLGSAPPNGFPLIVFSHGFTGCNTQSAFLMEALARAGYFVIAPNHADARCGTAGQGFGLAGLRPQEPFQNPKLWSDRTYRERYNDIEAVLDEVLRGQSFQGVPVDRHRIGIAGHSLGGYTAHGLAGAWPSWKDPRFKAVLGLSPFCSPYLDHGTLALGVPVMFQGGTLDFGITPFVRQKDGAFERASTPAYYVEFDGAGHLAWTDLNGMYQATIDTYSVAFFDRYLKGVSSDPLASLFDKPDAKISAARAK
jgi:predicted dienelactone hydrolase